jgi:hypothetical protein
MITRTSKISTFIPGLTSLEMMSHADMTSSLPLERTSEVPSAAQMFDRSCDWL